MRFVAGSWLAPGISRCGLVGTRAASNGRTCSRTDYCVALGAGFTNLAGASLENVNLDHVQLQAANLRNSLLANGMFTNGIFSMADKD